MHRKLSNSIFIAMEHTGNEQKKPIVTSLVKRFGVAGFLFFLIKGLLWLLIPSALIWLGYSI